MQLELNSYGTYIQVSREKQDFDVARQAFSHRSRAKTAR